MEKEKVLVSACLLGVNCRYDGKNGENEAVLKLMEDFLLVPVCPEQLGGMMTPRLPSEICGGNEDVRVMNRDGQDVTDFYVKGAREALRLARLYGCRYAILKERSPSCGHGMIYDGTFTGKKVPGNGVAAGLLEQNGIRVYGESEVDQFLLDLTKKQ